MLYKEVGSETYTTPWQSVGNYVENCKNNLQVYQQRITPLRVFILYFINIGTDDLIMFCLHLFHNSFILDNVYLYNCKYSFAGSGKADGTGVKALCNQFSLMVVWR